jgi:hypothetical protein
VCGMLASNALDDRLSRIVEHYAPLFLADCLFSRAAVDLEKKARSFDMRSELVEQQSQTERTGHSHRQRQSPWST